MSSIDGTNFIVWIASEDEGKPLCVGGKDGGFSITAYYDEEERITGVLIYNELELVEAAGVIPAERFKEEIEWLNSV